MVRKSIVAIVLTITSIVGAVAQSADDGNAFDLEIGFPKVNPGNNIKLDFEDGTHGGNGKWYLRKIKLSSGARPRSSRSTSDSRRTSNWQMDWEFGFTVKGVKSDPPQGVAAGVTLSRWRWRATSAVVRRKNQMVGRASNYKEAYGITLEMPPEAWDNPIPPRKRRCFSRGPFQTVRQGEGNVPRPLKI